MRGRDTAVVITQKKVPVSSISLPYSLLLPPDMFWFLFMNRAETCIENISRLMGSNVEDALQKKLMYLAYRFSPVVAGYKTMTAYHAGDGVWVELDVLLDEKTPLPLAHDVAETLQYCYEGMVEVDRAFVTIDYSSLGPLGHVEG